MRTMEGVTSTQRIAGAFRRSGAALSRRPVSGAQRSMSLHSDLERFWPSRRGHAFDEFCR
jgi:hypothetical protein